MSWSAANFCRNSKVEFVVWSVSEAKDDDGVCFGRQYQRAMIETSCKHHSGLIIEMSSTQRAEYEGTARNII